MMEYNDKLVIVSWLIWTIMIFITLVIIGLKNPDHESGLIFFLMLLVMGYISLKMIEYWLYPEHFKAIKGRGKDE